MLCEKCGKNEATYYYSETINGKKRSFALCSECAPGDISFGNSILSGLFTEHPFLTNQKSSATATKCEVCGSTFYEIRKNSKVGCPECYKTFRNELTPIIRKIHGTAVYKGKRNSDKTEASAAADVQSENVEVNETTKKIAELREKLKDAVSNENYELAATLRDKLRELTKKEGE